MDSLFANCNRLTWIFLTTLYALVQDGTGGSRLSHTAVKPDSHLARIFCQKMNNLIFV